MDKQQAFKTVLATLNEIYDKQLSDAAQSIWWSSLKDFTAAQIISAMGQHLKDPQKGTFCPKPADLIGKITGTEKQKQVATDDAALNAWELIIKQVRSKGAYGSLELDDKLALKAVQSIGGWIELCHTQESKMEWRRKEFISAYQTFTGSQDLPQSLAGIGQKNSEEIEARNQLNNIMEKAQDGIPTQAPDCIESR